MSSHVRSAELHFEVLLKDDSSETSEYVSPSTIGPKVRDWLLQDFAGFFVDTYVELPTNGGLKYVHLIQFIRVVDFLGPAAFNDYHALHQLTPIVHVYELHTPEDGSPVRSNKQGQQQGVQERMLVLPSKVLAGTWDSLMFDTVDPRQILRSITRISTLHLNCILCPTANPC